MTRTLLICIIFTTMFTYQSNGQGELHFISDQVEKIWETSDNLRKPESICFDDIKGEIYVSNINGSPTVKDSDGFISKLDKLGQIITLQWITGLHAPKGMALYDNLLYVTDIDELVIADRSKGTIIERIAIEGAQFLNDIAIDSTGTVFISDTYSKKLYSYKDGMVSEVLNEEKLSYPNGLTISKGSLFIGNSGYILKYDIESETVSEHCKTASSVDGLKVLKGNKCLFSDWKGNVYLQNDSGIVEKILDTSKVGIQAADLEYIPQHNLLLIPTFAYNTVSAYIIKK